MSIAKKLSGVARGVDVSWDLDYAYYSGGSEGDGSLADWAYTGNTGSYSAQEAAGSGVFIGDSGTKAYVVGLNDTVYQYTLSTPYDVSTMSYASKSVSTSPSTAINYGLDFNPDGTIMYLGGTGDIFYQFTLSTAWDVSTATYASKSLNLSSQGSMRGMCISSDGTKVYGLNDGSPYGLYQYTLSTPWDLSTGSYDSVSLTLPTKTYTGLCISSDGTKLYYKNETDLYWGVVSMSTALDLSTGTDLGSRFDDVSILTGAGGNGVVVNNFFYIVGNAADSIAQYSLNNRGIEGLDGAAYTGKSFDPTAQDTNQRGFFVGDSGTKLFSTGGTSEVVYQYTLSTPYDISTASYASKSFAASGQVADLGGVVFSPDGLTMILLDKNLAADTLYQYTLSTAWDVSTASYASKSMAISAFSTSIEVLFSSSTGSSLYIANPTTIYELRFSTPWDITTYTTFASFSPPNNVTGATMSVDGTKVIHTDNTGNDLRMLRLTTPYDISSAIDTGVVVATDSQTTVPRQCHMVNGFIYFRNDDDTIYQYVLGGVDTTTGQRTNLSWNDDGTKLFVAGTTQAVDTYNLSTPYDISTASFDSAHTITETTFYYGIGFKTDGTKMYLTSTNTDTIYQYSLSTAWDVTTETYDSKSFSLASQDTSPVDVNFSSDGTKMFILGAINDATYQYTLSTAWDVSTASYDSVSLSHVGNVANSLGMDFDSSGTRLFIYSNTDSKLVKYDLTTAWDLSTASLSQTYVAYDNTFIGVVMHPEGTGFVLTDQGGADILAQFTIGIQE